VGGDKKEQLSKKRKPISPDTKEMKWETLSPKQKKDQTRSAGRGKGRDLGEEPGGGQRWRQNHGGRRESTKKKNSNQEQSDKSTRGIVTKVQKRQRRESQVNRGTRNLKRKKD